jgi:hypothetical protein
MPASCHQYEHLQGVVVMPARCPNFGGIKHADTCCLNLICCCCICRVDLHSLQPTESGVQQHGKQQQQEETLLTAIKAVFEGGGVANSSNYLPLVLLFPLLAPLVQWLAFSWPDAKLARLAKVTTLI